MGLVDRTEAPASILVLATVMRRPKGLVYFAVLALTVLAMAAAPRTARALGLQISDLPQLRSVADVQLSPDGTHVIYAIVKNDRPGHPYTELWVMDVSSGTTHSLLPAMISGGGSHRWSPDSEWIAFIGKSSQDSGAKLMRIRPDGTGLESLAPVKSTNSPMPKKGSRLAWSPDGRVVAFVSATPGPEHDEANGDPMVIQRYLYKPNSREGSTRFNDNRRLHIFLVDIGTKEVRQLTSGIYYEHSLAWSPDGRRIAFISDRDENPRAFNYDIFTVAPSDGAVHQLTHTQNAEYGPVWSPDGDSIAYLGTKRPITSSETTMEDTHVWVMDSDGSNRREVGPVLDARHGFPGWSADGRHLYFTAQQQGSTRLFRIPASGGAAELVAPAADTSGVIRNWSTAAGDTVAFAMSLRSGDAELFTVRAGDRPKQLTNLNREILDARTIAPVKAFTFKSFDDMEVEAFLTKPVGIEPDRKYPLITLIHGGPHGQQGPTFNTHAQIYAAHGFATLMVNYRGSTGYGQEFADAIFKDQNGGEAKDVLAGVDAALARYSWLDANRLGVEGGSYGGQLTNWLITRTDRFKAAIPRAGISNLVSFNYMAYYHDYLAVEFGGYPTEDGIMDELWRRSPLRYANQVTTPTMFIHGENDNDVPIAEAEQFYIALKDVGVHTIMIRYPREGHGIREVEHVQDWLARSLKWYDKHFSL